MSLTVSEAISCAAETGVIIAGTLLLFLLQSKVRVAFA
jgi:hypothetical protein